MKRSGALFLLIALMAVAVMPVMAQNYPINWYPVISDQGQKMGNVLAEQKGDDIHLDFDFDQPYDCKLTELRYDIQNHPDKFPRDAKGDLNSGTYQYVKTYDKVRDAQVILDLPDRKLNQDVVMSARLWFMCDGGKIVKAAVEEQIGKQEHYFHFKASHTTQPTSKVTPTPQQSNNKRKNSQWYPGYWKDHGVETDRRQTVILGYGTNAQFSGPVNNPTYEEQYRWNKTLGKWQLERIPAR